MNMIERTQNEMSDVAAAAIGGGSDSRHSAALVASNLMMLSELELLHICGGEDTGAW